MSLKFPDKLYAVRMNKGADDEYFWVERNWQAHADTNEQVPVGVYQLVESGFVATNVELTIEKPKGRKS